ncbi:MAG: hypothetical protein ACTTH8_03880 [Treponema sp.]
MEIKTKSTFQEKIDTAIILRKLSGVLRKDNRKRRIIWSIFLLAGVLYLHLAVGSNNKILLFLSVILILLSLVNIIYANSINNKNIKKNIKRYYKIISKQYNYDFREPTDVTVKIDGDYLETESLGVVTKYKLKEYIRYFTELNFYIFEFNNGKYLFMNKECFPNEESLKNFENALLNNEEHSTSAH